MTGWRCGNDIAFGAGDSGCDSRAGQIRHKVANGSPSLRCFCGVLSCVTLALSRGDAPPNSLHAWA